MTRSEIFRNNYKYQAQKSQEKSNNVTKNIGKEPGKQRISANGAGKNPLLNDKKERE